MNIDHHAIYCIRVAHSGRPSQAPSHRHDLSSPYPDSLSPCQGLVPVSLYTATRAYTTLVRAASSLSMVVRYTTSKLSTLADQAHQPVAGIPQQTLPPLRQGLAPVASYTTALVRATLGWRPFSLSIIMFIVTLTLAVPSDPATRATRPSLTHTTVAITLH